MKLLFYFLALTCLTREGYTGSSESNNFIDYHFESKEYEKKLIQVAEMHGELMEFNERLHRLLSQKEQTVRRLREELVDLRGPVGGLQWTTFLIVLKTDTHVQFIFCRNFSSDMSLLLIFSCQTMV